MTHWTDAAFIILLTSGWLWAVLALVTARCVA